MKHIPFYLGIISLLIAWAGPLPDLAHSSFYSHMIMHMLNVAVAAPLIALGILNVFIDKIQKHPAFFPPIAASVVELLIVWGWHAPGLHHIARHTVYGLVLEQGTFFISGVWLWISAFSKKEAGVIGLLLTSMHMTFLGALLSLSSRQLYLNHMGFRELTALEDQQIGGAIMLVVGGISYLSGGLWLTFQTLKEKKGAIYEELA